MSLKFETASEASEIIDTKKEVTAELPAQVIELDYLQFSQAVNQGFKEQVRANFLNPTVIYNPAPTDLIFAEEDEDAEWPAFSHNYEFDSYSSEDWEKDPFFGKSPLKFSE
ncbi:MAG: hypothetical protein M1169_00200 [Firmicutes bacterium]|nr:hypothetical protein [Bacillota bacterium]